MKALVLLLAILSAAQGLIEPFGTEVCRLFKDGTKLRKPGETCKYYLTCKNGKGTESTCKTGSFDRNSGSCKTLASDSYCKQPCGLLSPTWVADPKSCNGYYKCSTGFGTQGYCPDDLHFNQKKQSCVYKEDSTCYGYNLCDIAPDNTPFKHETNCEMYYTCSDGVLIENVCNRGYYDVQLGCVNKADVVCPNHPIPYNICGTPKKPIWDKFVSDERTCRGYFYCQDKGFSTPDLNPSWGQCPEGKFFETNYEGCAAAAAVKCIDDRCDGRKRIKVISGRKGCQHYLICNGDLTVREEKCPDGMYFNDDTMECTTTIQNYIACS